MLTHASQFWCVMSGKYQIKVRFIEPRNQNLIKIKAASLSPLNPSWGGGVPIASHYLMETRSYTHPKKSVLAIVLLFHTVDLNHYCKKNVHSKLSVSV